MARMNGTSDCPITSLSAHKISYRVSGPMHNRSKGKSQYRDT